MSFKDRRIVRTYIVMAAVIAAAVSPRAAKADGPAFEFSPITHDIVSATFSVDMAAFTGHRTLAGYPVNSVMLLDPSSLLPACDISENLFGTAAFPDTPIIDLGLSHTEVFSTPIDAAFFPVLRGGSVGLSASLTDTWDGMFAIDYMSITIETTGGTIESYFGSPLGNENNGYGIGLADNADLPGSLLDVIPMNSTNTGFDETISGFSVLAVPEPGSLLLSILVAAPLLLRRRK